MGEISEIKHGEVNRKRFWALWVEQHSKNEIVDQLVSLEKERDKLKESTIDSLTGLPGRQLFMDKLEEYRKEVDYESETILVFLIDVDGLKEANDQFGHAKGDDLLFKVSKILSQLTGKNLVCRWGGDEFLLVTKLQRKAIDQEVEILLDNMLTESNKEKVSFSVGIAKLEEDELLKEVLDKADRRMYDDKKGRNKNRK